MTTRERRLRAEWVGLKELAALNPKRFSDLVWDDATMALHLHEVPALGRDDALLHTHHLVFDFPMLFPALPMSLILQTPVQHPNVHPETGFVCLWESHRIGHTVEQALHKVVAMLSGELMNADPVHVMQPEAFGRFQLGGPALRLQLKASPLLATGSSWQQRSEVRATQRRRLS